VPACYMTHTRSCIFCIPCTRRLRRPRRYNPVQLLESREYMYSESVFLHWLNLAITLASVAVLLMGYSSMAYVNPLKRPTMHVAEIICLLMLPCSCLMVGYAIRSYVWRSKRLHSMRYRCAVLIIVVVMLLQCVPRSNAGYWHAPRWLQQ
jgi:uncharacterized membrane protein YidH (DUF202 family)